MSRKLLTLVALISALMLVGTAQADISIGGRVSLDLSPWEPVNVTGQSQVIESGYPVWGWYSPIGSEPYYPLTVTHSKSGNLSHFLKYSPKKHEVFNPPGTIPPYPEDNVFISARLPKWMPTGYYEAVIENKGCSELDGTITICASISTRVSVEVINENHDFWNIKFQRFFRYIGG